MLGIADFAWLQRGKRLRVSLRVSCGESGNEVIQRKCDAIGGVSCARAAVSVQVHGSFDDIA